MEAWFINGTPVDRLDTSKRIMLSPFYQEYLFEFTVCMQSVTYAGNLQEALLGS